MTATVTVTLKRSFLNLAREDAVVLPTPVKETKAADTFEMNHEQFADIRSYAHDLAAYEDHENKLVAANVRRAGESALATLKEITPPDAPAKPKAPTKKELRAKAAAEKRAAAKPSKVKAADTAGTLATLNRAFDFFNVALFDGKLPPVMLVAHRKRNAHGYFWEDQWASTQDGEARMSEIALNPETMSREPKVVLSTLVHEMVHHEQHCFGTPSKSGHNVEWIDWMARVGLEAFGVGSCAGKKSGPHFSHKIVEGGAYDKAATEFLKQDDIDLSWFAVAPARAKKQDRSKLKHTCDCCGTNIWGREGIEVYCCDEQMRPAYYV